MANSPTAESSYPSQREEFAAELELAFNFARFASAAADPELARYVHAKARESYRRLIQWSKESRSTDAARNALQTLQVRLEEFRRSASNQ